MDPTSWKHAFELFDTYGDLPIDDFMTRIEKLPLDQEVKNILLKLKTSEKASSDYFDNLGEKLTSMVKPETPKKLGDWNVLEHIETGGMSSVYLVERNDESFSMKAAAKLIHFGGYNPRILKRFKREVEFLTLLDHPNITRIIDWGVAGEGVPWYIMEYVEGVPITCYCQENELNLNQRLELFTKVCDAVQHAHKNLVIHRDLKPTNIFVDKSGEVKLLDFGIAKAISPGPSDAQDHMLTMDNQALMTPVYASPEQLGSEPLSTASDVYSLGIILHELVTGQRPYSFNEVNPVKMLAQMKEQPLERPSAVFGSTKEKPRGIRKNRLNPELDDILLTALRFEPERRYGSAEQLARDIRNLMSNKPIMARPDSKGYRFKKFVQRHKAGVAASAFSLLVLVAAAGIVFWQAEQTKTQAERAVAMKDFLVTMVSASNPFIGPGETPTVRDMLEYGSRNVEEELSEQPLLAAEMLGVIGTSFHGLGEAGKAREYLERSMQLASKNGGLDPITEAQNRATHAHTMIGTGETEAARELARAALRDVENVSGSEQVRGTLLNIIAGTYFITAEYDTALEYALEAMDLTCSAYGETHSSCIQTNIELQYFYERVGENEKALDASGRAWELAMERYADNPHPQLVMAAGAYGSALSLFARNDEAIPLLEQNVQHSLDIYGEDNFRYARGMDWLTLAYQAAGRTHDVLTTIQKLIPIGEAAVPRNPLTPVWMHREVHSAVHLRKPGVARQALSERGDRLPERYPAHISHAYSIFELLIRHQEGESAAVLQQEALELVMQLEEEGSGQLNEARLAALLLSVEAGDSETSARLLEDASGARIQNATSDVTPARYYMLEARYHFLNDDAESAAESLRNAEEILSTARHNDGPFLAEHRALEAELLCRTGETDKGRMMLDSSLSYWQETAQSELGEQTMRNMAGSCE
ncbi:MAG: serine/threonine protein kinase [Balneolia bacterium]|nr:serine/threonine protein kinase [Balneolia bacterium]